MPRICVMSSVHPAGDTRIYLKELKSLKRAGYEVIFLNRERDGDDEDGIQFIKIDIPEGRLKRIFISPFKLYRKAVRQKADAYHFHDPELLPIGLLLKIKGKNVIYDVHEDVPSQILTKPYLTPFLLKVISWFFAPFEKFCARRFTMNITATPFITEIFLKHRCKALAVNNYPLLEEFAAAAAMSRQASDRVAYVGYITKIRGIHELVEAVGKSKATLELVGEFEDEALLEKTTAQKGWAQVNYHGYKGRQDINEILSRSLAGILNYLPTPDCDFAQPNKLFEYMAAGVAVIASHVPLWKDIVEGGECGVCIDPNDPDDIARAINFMVDNPDKAEAMGQNGRKLVQTIYSWDTEEKKLLGFYEELFREMKSGGGV